MFDMTGLAAQVSPAFLRALLERLDEAEELLWEYHEGEPGMRGGEGWDRFHDRVGEFLDSNMGEG
jgi:hypothetical protein